MTNLRLIAIDRRGRPTEKIADAPDLVDEIGRAHASMYAAEGFTPPWIGYFAVDEGRCVGCCSFKSPPKNGEVEIAYFTFPPFEGRRYATNMAERLVALAGQTDPTVNVTAQTLPDESPSTAILRRLHFELIGTVDHPEDGPVWHWRREPTNDS